MEQVKGNPQLQTQAQHVKKQPMDMLVVYENAVVCSMQEHFSKHIETTYVTELELNDGCNALHNLHQIDKLSHTSRFTQLTRRLPVAPKLCHRHNHIISICKVLQMPQYARLKGLFRVPANKRKVEELLDQINSRQALDFGSFARKHGGYILCGLLRKLLSTTSYNIFGVKQIPVIRKIMAIPNEEMRLQTIQCFLLNMNYSERQVLVEVMSLLETVASHVEENSMDAENLARCIMPTLMTIEVESTRVVENQTTSAIDFIRTLIDHRSMCFDVSDQFAWSLSRAIEEEVSIQLLSEAENDPTSLTSVSHDIGKLVTTHLEICKQWRDKYYDAIECNEPQATVRSIREKLEKFITATLKLMDDMAAGVDDEEQEKLKEELRDLKKLHSGALSHIKRAFAHTPKRAKKVFSKLRSKSVMSSLNSSTSTNDSVVSMGSTTMSSVERRASSPAPSLFMPSYHSPNSAGFRKHLGSRSVSSSSSCVTSQTHTPAKERSSIFSIMRNSPSSRFSKVSNLDDMPGYIHDGGDNEDENNRSRANTFVGRRLASPLRTPSTSLCRVTSSSSSVTHIPPSSTTNNGSMTMNNNNVASMKSSKLATSAPLCASTAVDVENNKSDVDKTPPRKQTSRFVIPSATPTRVSDVCFDGARGSHTGHTLL